MLILHYSGGFQVADVPLARQSSAASGKPTLFAAAAKGCYGEGGWRRRAKPAPASGWPHASPDAFSAKVEPTPVTSAEGGIILDVRLRGVYTGSSSCYSVATGCATLLAPLRVRGPLGAPRE